MKQHLAIKPIKWAMNSLLMKTALCLMGGVLLLSGSSQGCFIVGDLSGDCRVDIDDLVIAASQWMQASCEGETGLAAHWKFDAGSGTTAVDSSGSGYNGVVAGASWNPAGGVLGGALQFDGNDDYVWITQGYRGVTGSNRRTCAAWIKTDQPSGDIMTWGDMSIDGSGWIVRLDETGALRVDAGGGYIFGTTVLTDDFWHHIAVTSDGSTTDNIVLYVDGRVETTAEVFSQSINTQGTATAKLGVYLGELLSGNYFNGLIDDARIYDRVLTMKEIWSLAITGTTNFSCPDLNSDGTVNLYDFAQISKNWKEATPPILINEFLADNESKSPLEYGEILDGNNESSDWIELHNNSENAIDISRWYLTDDSILKTKWRFPAGMDQLVLQPGDYLIVFASGKTQAENPGNYPYVDPAGYLHTNFQLSNNGEYLALIGADGTTPVHEYDHFDLGDDEYGYPRQQDDISYGFYYDQPRYFSQPTPGTVNKDSFTGFAEKPDVNIKGGCYVDGIDLTMTCDTDGAFIRYTTDGTVPGLDNGMEYTGPIHIDSLTTIIAKSFKPGLERSDARIETYIFVDSGLAPFNSNLPIIVIDTVDVTIPQDKTNKPWTHCRVVIIDTDEITGRADITGPEHFEGVGQIRYRGESTYGTKRHFAFETQDEYGQDQDVSLLGMPAESDWVITGEKLDYTLLKCEIAFKWFRDMGHYAPRQRYVEMYINEGGGKISTGDYKGIFVLREKIKRSKNRVDIARLDTSHNLEPKVSGGYILKNDKWNTGDTLLKDYMEKAGYGIAYDGAGKAILEDPGPLEVTGPQIDWITNYLNEFHSVLWQNTGSSYYPGPEPDYTDYIDVISMIDHFIVEQTGADADAFWGSYFTHKDRDGKIYSGPPWDFDRGFHNNAGNSNSYTSWKSNGAIFGKWHQKLPEYYLEYRIMLADRWFEHRKVVTNTALTMEHIDQTVALITEAMGRSINKYGFPGSGGNYAGEVALFKNWITNRLNHLDGEFAGRFAKEPPIFSRSGGYVDQGQDLYISLPSGGSGTVYYTLNGEDPRLEGGGINPNAEIYTDPGGPTTETITLVTEDAAKAVLVPNTDIGMSWTGGAEPYDDSTWTHGTPTTGITVGGVGYDEQTRYTGFITYDVESLMNNVMGTCYIRIPFTAEADDIADATSMTLRIRYDDGFRAYLNDTPIASDNAPSSPDWDTDADGQPDDSLAEILIDFNCSEHLGSLQTGYNILAIRGFNQGTGSSDFLISAELVIEVDSTPPSSGDITFDKSTCVKARIKAGGDWSAMNTEVYALGPVLENLRITEIMYHPADPNTEFIELQNVGPETINLNLVQFTKGVEFVFGDTSLAAGEYGLIVQNMADFTARYGAGLNVLGQYLGRLDNDGDRIEFQDAVGTVIQNFKFEDNWYELTDGVGFSLTMVNPDATDPTDWDHKYGWRSSLAQGGTPGYADIALAADSIIINELLAHSHQADPDWIELYNTTDQDINISGWFLSDDDSDPDSIRKYEIPPDTTIKANSYKVFIEHLSFGNPSLPQGQGFGLSEAGETVYLYSGENGQTTGYYQTQQKFDASQTGITFGRYEKEELSGGNDFVRMASATQGTVNSAPLIPPIVITEIHYNPDNGTDYDFVELYNRSGSDVTLMNMATTETSPGVFITEEVPWRLEGTGYEFPPDTVIGAGEYILVAKDPTKYSSPSYEAYGPYDGKLDNGGEELAIQIPGDKEYGDDRYWIPIEKIDYDDQAPWPTSTDGTGDSLHRNDINAYGRDYSNWHAAIPTPGS